MKRPLVITQDQRLIQSLAGLADALHLSLIRTVEPRQVNRLWLDAPCVVVGDDSAHLVPGALRRPHVVLVVGDMDDATVFERGARMGAAAVLWLPDHIHRLAAHMVGAIHERT